MSLKTQLDALAEKMLTDALAPEVKAETRVDIFKAVTQYHLGAQRATKAKFAPPPDDETSFADIARQVREPRNGGTA